jgi:hypothetical protein
MFFVWFVMPRSFACRYRRFGENARLIKPSWMRCAGNLARVWKWKCIEILVGRFEGRKPLRRIMRKLEENIKIHFIVIKLSASVVWWLALKTINTEVPGSIPGHSLGFFWGSWVWNGVQSALWSDKLCSYLNKEVTVQFRKLKNAAVGFDVLITCQPSTVWCSRERLPAAAAQPSKARQSCSASDYYYYFSSPEYNINIIIAFKMF